MEQKPVIYQLLPRIFSNYNPQCTPGGTLAENGSGKMNDITTRVLGAVRSLGITHVWYTGVIEHAHRPDYTAYGIPRHNPHIIKGEAGSPYAITDYYDVDPDIAVSVNDRIKEFERLVRRTHDAGMKVIIDFVPNHVGREYHSDAAPAGAPASLGTDDRTDWFFAQNNNFYYLNHERFAPEGVDLGEGAGAYVEKTARASGNDCFTARPGRFDWYDTVKLNYGVDYSNHSLHFDPIPDTWHKMLHILQYWAGKGVDGFRCDMAHMVPLEFWQWAIARVKSAHPGVIFIAEIYDMALYYPYIHTGGFDYLYDKVNLYDTLRAIETSHCPASAITGCWQRLGDMEPHMLNFLENHDEQRFASPFYAGDAMRVIPSLVVSATIGTGAMMIYAGQELGEPGMDAEGYSGRDGRTTIFDYWSIDTLRRWLNSGRPAKKLLTPAEIKLRGIYARILGLCTSESAIREGSFFDLMYVNRQNPALDPDSQYAYLRHSTDQTLLIAVNFSDAPAEAEINIPAHAFEYMRIAPGEYTCTELLGDAGSFTAAFTPERPLAVTIPAHGAVIIDLKKSTSTHAK